MVRGLRRPARGARIACVAARGGSGAGVHWWPRGTGAPRGAVAQRRRFYDGVGSTAWRLCDVGAIDATSFRGGVASMASRWTATVAILAKARHRDTPGRRRRTFKTTYHAVRGRLLPPPLARASNCPSKVKWWTSSSTISSKSVLAERLCHVGGGRHGRAQAARAAAGHTKSPAARAGAADVGAASTKTGAQMRGLLRPAAASVVLRRSAGATAVRSLSDGVTECVYSDTPWGYQQQPRPSPAEFADRGAASLLATLDAPAWTPQQRPQRAAAAARHGARVGPAAARPRRSSRPPRPQVPDPSPPWLAGMLDEAPPAAAGGLRPRAASNTAAAAARFDGGFGADLGLRRYATRRRAALPRPRASSVSSSVARTARRRSGRIALKVVPVDEQKTPWLATADLPARRAAPIEQLRPPQSAVEAGNAPLYKSSNGEEKRASARNAATIVGSRCDRATAAASS